MGILKHSLTTVVDVIVLWLLAAIVLECIVISLVPLGAWYGLAIKVIVPVVALYIVYLIKLFRLCPKPHAKQQEKRLTRKQWIIIAIVFMLLVLSSLFLSILDPFDRADRSRPEDAKIALGYFEVHNTSLIVERARLERTLAEFERARRRLLDEWSQPKESSRIPLYLYKNRTNFLAGWGLKEAAGAAACLETGPIIGVPLEQASETGTEQPASNTPLHEMVHAMMCQSLGRSSFYSVPRWFHEGMAELYSEEGIFNLFGRIFNRLMIWHYRQDLMPPDTFCSYEASGSAVEVSRFYATTWEFLRSLDGRYGRHALTRVIDLVASGATFEDSLLNQLGGTCTELYTEWIRAFNGSVVK